VCQESRPSVRILGGIDEHDRLGEDGLNRGIFKGREDVVGLRHSRSCGRNLVSVYAVVQRDDDRKFRDEPLGFGWDEGPGVGESTYSFANLVDSAHVPRGRDEDGVQVPALPGGSVSNQACPIRSGFVKGAEVSGDFRR
jgi:hypothetical protein